MIRRPPRSTRVRSSAASDVYKRQLVSPRRMRLATAQHGDSTRAPRRSIPSCSSRALIDSQASSSRGRCIVGHGPGDRTVCHDSRSGGSSSGSPTWSAPSSTASGFRGTRAAPLSFFAVSPVIHGCRPKPSPDGWTLTTWRLSRRAWASCWSRPVGPSTSHTCFSSLSAVDLDRRSTSIPLEPGALWSHGGTSSCRTSSRPDGLTVARIFPDAGYYARVADATDFPVGPLETVFRLLDFLASVDPAVMARFALRGGTALNLAHLDMPRLSVCLLYTSPS